MLVTLKHSLPKQSVDAIDFINMDMGEAGWIIYLKDGWSFDPGSVDITRFVPLDDPSEADNFLVYKI
jgi:hypothetical protein